MMALFLAADNPVEHVVNARPHGDWAVLDLFGLHNVWIWSSHVGTLFLAGLLTVVVLWWAATRIATGPASQGTERYVTRNPLAHTVEVICLYLRESSVRPLLGDRTDRFMPFLWTIFFFILFNNLLGLTPITDTAHLIDTLAGGHYLTGLVGATATQNIFVTAALAIIAAIVINVAGVMNLGVAGYLAHLTAGTKWYLWPLMVPIEILGTAIKPVALTLRLFANMTAGHILVAVLLMFTVQGLGMLAKLTVGGLALGSLVTIASLGGVIGIYFLELFVAFLQAFVFMFLTAVFIAQLSPHHDHEHEAGHGHEHAHA